MLKNIGSKIKEKIRENRTIKTRMTQIIQYNGATDPRDTLEQLIQICLICEVDAQEAIEALDKGSREQVKTINMILLGYVNA